MSVADAAIGAVVRAASQDAAVTVVTSDPTDIRLAAGAVAIDIAFI